MTKPITPDEADKLKVLVFPSAVIEAWNELIIKSWNGRQAVVMQDDALRLIVDRMKCSRERVFDQRWLDIEQVYREAGWTIEYDKPGYNETYAASFKFTKSKSP